MNIVSLGEAAGIVYLPDESHAVRLANAIRTSNPSWLEDVVPAYASVGLFFNPAKIDLTELRTWLKKLPLKAATAATAVEPIAIPVCYEFALDLTRVASVTSLDADAIIAAHLRSEYTVYAIGFVPGFPYLGYLPPELCGVPRLDSPRLRVEPGSVGLTARQTGIYPLPRPGGWNIIGRTPISLVDVATEYFPLRVGDMIRFERIDETEYTHRLGERLTRKAPE